MKKNQILIIATILFVLLACSLPILWILISSMDKGGFQMLADIAKSSNQPTPFQPFQYTTTPTRDIKPITDALVPNAGLVPPEGQINILLLGSDWRPNSGFRTDVILLVSIYIQQSKVSLVSFPRDLWVQLPGMQEERINTAMGYGGFGLVQSTFERNFAVHLDHYMMTDFSGFKAIIDTLGGIDINASKNTADKCDLSYQRGAWCSIGPGEAHLDGELALWYVRSRYTSNDFDRTRRAQEVIEGIFKKIMSLNGISRAPELYTLFINSVETDMGLNDFLELINVAPAILSDPSRVRRYAIGTDHVTPYVDPGSGANILLPNYNQIWSVIQEAVYTP